MMSMKQYPNLKTAVQDALKLAEGMTFKYAVANMSRGGGKTVIHLPEEFDYQQRPDPGSMHAEIP